MKFEQEFTEDEEIKIEEEFSRLRIKEVHYLDTAGSALYGEGQIRQICQLLTTDFFCNPHTSRATDNIVDQVRYR